MSNTIAPIIGHESVQAQLARYLQSGKMPHGLLFSGPRGVGKAAVADTLMRCLLTDAAKQEEAAGLFGDALPEEVPASLSYDATHPAIARIESGGHGNLMWVEPRRDEKKKMSFTTIDIEQIREVVDFMHKTTSEEGWRIVVIDPADGLNSNAENGLLKVLEEPPAQTLLVLISSQPDKLLPTTRSRCREMVFHPPMQQQIIEILQAKKISPTVEQQQWLAALAPASAGQWASYIDAEADKLYTQWLEMLSSEDAAAMQSFAVKQAKLEAKEWQISGDLLLAALHRLVLSSYDSTLELLAIEQEYFSVLLARADAEHWQEVWQRVVYWWPQTIQSNYDKKQVLQSLLFESQNVPKKAA